MTVGFLDLTRVLVPTSGTGAVASIGATVAGFLSFPAAGAVDGTTYRYSIQDPNGSSEIGTGVYTAAGPSITRNPTKSTNGNARINLSGNAQLIICLAAEDMFVTLGTTQMNLTQTYGTIGGAIGWTGAQTFTGGLNINSIPVLFSNSNLIEWSNGTGVFVSGSFGANMFKFSDNNFYFDNFDSGTFFWRTNAFVQIMSLNSAGNLTLLGQVSASSGVNAGNGFVTGGNTGTAFPTNAVTAWAIGDNFSNGQREVNFWNRDVNVTGLFSFIWYQQTGSAAQTQLASMGPAGFRLVTGSFGVNNLVSNGVLYGGGSGAFIAAVAVNGSATNKFLTQSSGGVPAWNTIQASDLPGGFTGFGTPSANSVGINAPSAGTSSLAIRSDAVLQLSQAISPTWTGNHTFTTPTFSTQSGGQQFSGFYVQAAIPSFAWNATGAGADQHWWDLRVSGTTIALRAVDDANSTASNVWSATRGVATAITNMIVSANLGVLTTPGINGLDVAGGIRATQAFANQLIANTTGTVQQATLIFSEAGSGKWQMGKQTDNSWFLYDVVRNASVISVDTNGLLSLGESNSTVLVPLSGSAPGLMGVNTFTPNAVLHVVGRAGTTALQVTGAAAQILVDNVGTGANYIDGSSTSFRPFGSGFAYFQVSNGFASLLGSVGGAFLPQFYIINQTFDNHSGYLRFQKSRGALGGTGAAVQVNDAIGTILLEGQSLNGLMQQSTQMYAIVTAVGSASVSSDIHMGPVSGIVSNFIVDLGNIQSNGAAAGLIFADRTSNAQWQWYAQGGSASVARLFFGSDLFAVASTGFVGIGAAPSSADAFLTINGNTAALPTGTLGAGTVLHVIGSTGSAAITRIDSFGAVAALILRRSNGSIATPVAINSGDVLGQIAVQGFTGSTGYSANRTALNFNAAETWNATANGMTVALNTCLTGTVTNSTRLGIDGAGNFGFNIAAAAMVYHFHMNSGTLALGMRMNGTIMEFLSTTDGVGQYSDFSIGGNPLRLNGLNGNAVFVGLANAGGILNLNFNNFVVTIGQQGTAGTPVIQSFTSGGTGAGNWDTQLTYSGGVIGQPGRGVFGYNGQFSNLTIAATLDAGITVQQQPGGTIGGQYFSNQFLITNWNINAGSNLQSAHAISATINGVNNVASSTGFFALAAQTIIQSVGSGTKNSSYNAILGFVQATANIPGGATNFGMFGVNANMFINANVTGVFEISAFEADMTVQSGANPAYRTGHNMVFGATDAVRGSVVDASFYWTMAAGSSPGWGNIFLLDFTSSRGGPTAGTAQGVLMGSTSAIFSTVNGTAAILTGFDISALVVLGNAFRSPHFNVDGQGNLTGTVTLSTIQTSTYNFGAGGSVGGTVANQTADTWASVAFTNSDTTTRIVPYVAGNLTTGAGWSNGNALNCTVWAGYCGPGSGDPTPQGSTITHAISMKKKNFTNTQVYGQTGAIWISIDGGFNQSATNGTGNSFLIQGNITNGSNLIKNVVNLSSPALAIVQGLQVTGTGFPAFAAGTGAIIISVSGTTLTMNINSTASGSVTLNVFFANAGFGNMVSATPGDVFGIDGNINYYHQGSGAAVGVGQFAEILVQSIDTSGSTGGTVSYACHLGMAFCCPNTNSLGATIGHMIGYQAIQASLAALGGVGVAFFAGSGNSTWGDFGMGINGTAVMTIDMNGSIVHPSDPALKRNIRHLFIDVRQLVLDVDPVHYRWKHNRVRPHLKERDGHGFLAYDHVDEDGKKVQGLKEAFERQGRMDFMRDTSYDKARTHPNQKIWGFCDTELIPYLWLGEKKLFGEIDRIDNEIKALSENLNTRVAQLEARVAELEAAQQARQ